MEKTPGAFRSYGGFIRGFAFAFIIQAIVILALYLAVKHALPYINQWMVANALRGMGFGS
jgi:hypothetical protein